MDCLIVPAQHKEPVVGDCLVTHREGYYTRKSTSTMRARFVVTKAKVQNGVENQFDYAERDVRAPETNGAADRRTATPARRY